MVRTCATYLIDYGRLCLDRIDREVRRTDLLRDTTRFTLLHVRLTNLTTIHHHILKRPLTE